MKNVLYNYLDCSQTKITNLDCVIIMQEYIIGFKISMNNILCMEVTEKKDNKLLDSASPLTWEGYTYTESFLSIKSLDLIVYKKRSFIYFS